MTVSKQFGQRLKQIRTERNLSQERLAELTHCHRTYIGQIERAEKNITLNKVFEIAEGLNVEVAELLDFKKGRE